MHNRTLPRAQISDFGIRDPLPSGVEANHNSIMKLLGQKRSMPADALQSVGTSSDRRLELRKYMANGTGSDVAAHRIINTIPSSDLAVVHNGNTTGSAASSTFFDRR